MKTGLDTVGAKKFIPTRRSLLSRIKRWEDGRSWEDFFNTYWKLIYNVALRAGLPPPDAEEIVQETVVAVAKRIGRFEYQPQRCSFKSWLLLITRSRITDHLRRQRNRFHSPAKPTNDSIGTSTIERLPDDAPFALEKVWDQEWAQNLADAALERVKRQTSDEQFQLFDLYVVKGWPAGEVARTLRVSTMKVYLAKHRVSALIRKQIKALEQEITRV